MLPGNKTLKFQLLGFQEHDNDIPGTEYTVGFDTSVPSIKYCIRKRLDRLRDTATSHVRTFIVEAGSMC